MAKQTEPVILEHLPAVQPELSGWLRIINNAVDRGTPIDQLGKLLDMQREWEREQARKAYYAAVSAFKAEAPRLSKNKTVRYESNKGPVEYDHITLASACDILIPSLAKHNLHHAWVTAQSEGIVEVTCRLSHSDGHSESVTLRGAPDQSGSKNAIQAVGSTVTYLQRYTFLSIVGMAADDQDDDGGMMVMCESAKVSPEQIGVINDWIDACAQAGRPITFKRFLNWLKVEELDQLDQAGFSAAVIELSRLHKEAKAKNGGAK